MLTVLFLLLISFSLLWVGSGLAVKSITTISHSLRVSGFFVSFFILGFFTSITEILVGITALIENKPEIYVGNLLGSSVVIYLLIIPILAVGGNGIKVNHSFHIKDIVKASIVVSLPALLTLDNKFTLVDAVICIVSYAYIIALMNQKGSLLEKIFHKSVSRKTIYVSVLKIFIALILVFIGSNILVNQIPELGELIHISPFIISVLLVSIGTNIPELSIALRSIISRHKEIALGNYLGSSALNTLEIGVLTLFGKSAIPADGSNYSVVTFVLALILFVVFIRSKSDISRKEGSVLLAFYVLFAIFEIYTGPGWILK